MTNQAPEKYIPKDLSAGWLEDNHSEFDYNWELEEVLWWRGNNIHVAIYSSALGPHVVYRFVLKHNWDDTEFCPPQVNIYRARSLGFAELSRYYGVESDA